MVLFSPRGWSALHFREGDWKSCSGGIIRGNEIVSSSFSLSHPYERVEREKLTLGGGLVSRDPVERSGILPTTERRRRVLLSETLEVMESVSLAWIVW